MLGYIGAEGDEEKGPHYVGADFSNEEGTTARTDQAGTTQIDTNKIENDVEGARAIGHEADHDLYAKDHGAANTEDKVRTSEKSAYATEGIIARAFGIDMSAEDQALGEEGSVDKWKARQEDKENEE